MAQYRKVKALTAIDAAYIAGLIDGEGTITLTRKHRLENRQISISISSTEKQLLWEKKDLLRHDSRKIAKLLISLLNGG